MSFYGAIKLELDSSRLKKLKFLRRSDTPATLEVIARSDN
jgi:hypothetical protein